MSKLTFRNTGWESRARKIQASKPTEEVCMLKVVLRLGNMTNFLKERNNMIKHLMSTHFVFPFPNLTCPQLLFAQPLLHRASVSPLRCLQTFRPPGTTTWGESTFPNDAFVHVKFIILLTMMTRTGQLTTSFS